MPVVGQRQRAKLECRRFRASSDGLGPRRFSSVLISILQSMGRSVIPFTRSVFALELDYSGNTFELSISKKQRF